jgi:hypothetical protein
MPRACTVCLHRNREKIDRALLRGETLRAVGARFDTSWSAIHRHKRHLKASLARAKQMQADENSLGYSLSLLDEIGCSKRTFCACSS